MKTKTCEARPTQPPPPHDCLPERTPLQACTRHAFATHPCLTELRLLWISDLSINELETATMRVAKEKVEVKMEIPGAVVRQQTDFGDASGLGRISGEYFTLSAGVDTTALFQGLEGDLCQSPHWGYVLRGRVTTTDANGTQETVTANDLFYWPPGHNVRVDADAELVMFSPQHEHSQVINHMIAKVKASM